MLDGKSVLIVDDNPDIRALGVRALTPQACSIHQAADGRQAIRVLETQSVDLVVLDILMPEQEGVETIIQLKRRWPMLKVLAISGGGRIGTGEVLNLAKHFGADATMKKPFSFSDLVMEVHTLLGSPTMFLA